MATKGGSVGTMGSLLAMLPAQKIGIAMVFNDIDYGKVQLLKNIVKVMLGAPPAPYAEAPAPKAVPATGYRMNAARLRALAGVYDTRAGVMRLMARGDSLVGRHEGNDIVLEPTSDTSFVMRSVLREQEGAPIVIKKCGARMCLWMEGDSSAVRR